MSAFPMFIELEGKSCLVVGGGSVARRKALALLDCGGKVTLVAPRAEEALLSHPGVTVLLRVFQESDLERDWALVIAASDDPQVNAQVAEGCGKRRIPVNRADEQEGFLFPALIQRGDLTVGISTGGASPWASGYIRRLLEATLPEKCGEILHSLRQLREEIKGRFPRGKGREEILAAAAKRSFQKDAALNEEEREQLLREPSGGTGRVHLVGAGCGSADLITLRGMKLLQTCDAVVYDELIDKALLSLVPARAEKISMGKRAGRPSPRQEDITGTLIDLAKQGKEVVRLKGGDPYLFGRGGEELLSLRKAGIPCDEVPGIPSPIGIPAEYGIPVTHRNVSRSLHIITAHTAASDSLPEGMEAYAKLEGTLVFLMGLGKLEKIADSLMENGKHPKTPAAVLSGGNAPQKACIRGTLDTIAELGKHAQAPAIILIGAVAGALEE